MKKYGNIIIILRQTELTKSGLLPRLLSYGRWIPIQMTSSNPQTVVYNYPDVLDFHDLAMSERVDP